MNNVESKIGVSIHSKAKEEIIEDGMRGGKTENNSIYCLFWTVT